MSEEYNNEKSGYLWHEVDASVERKGTFQIDGKKYYGLICKSLNNMGEVKYEFYLSAGLIHLVTDKKTERSPDMSGTITINNKEYKLGCWAKESDKGPFTSLGFQEKKEAKPAF